MHAADDFHQPQAQAPGLQQPKPNQPHSGREGSFLGATTQPLADLYQAMIVDLDGVVYWGSTPVPHATASLQRTAERGVRLLYVTNNTARAPAEIAAHLHGTGLAVSTPHIITSAQIAARMTAELVPIGAAILMLGGRAMADALAEHGLIAVHSLDKRPQAVVQSLAPEVTWTQLADAGYAVASGLPWVASNMDLVVPRDRGLAPGNGALVEVVRTVTGRAPLVAGKPEPGIYQQALRRAGASRALAIGDRLDTDIAGARCAGIDSMLVLTGVTSVTDLLVAPSAQRPMCVATDLRDLLLAHPAVVKADNGWACGTCKAEVVDGEVTLLPRAASLGLNAIRALWMRHMGSPRPGPISPAPFPYQKATRPARVSPGSPLGRPRRSGVLLPIVTLAPR